MLGINFQLVEIDSNRRLSRIVRILASPNIRVIVLWNDGYDEHGIIIPAMVTIVMLLNDISHVWHWLVANLKMNSYNELDDRIIKCIAKLVAFYAKYCQTNSTYKALHNP